MAGRRKLPDGERQKETMRIYATAMMKADIEAAAQEQRVTIGGYFRFLHVAFRAAQRAIRGKPRLEVEIVREANEPEPQEGDDENQNRANDGLLAGGARDCDGNS